MANPGVGDRLYMGGTFTGQYRHHPGAPQTYAPGNDLKNTYIHCQHHARMCFIQSYGFNTQNVEGDADTTRSFLASTSSEWVAIAKGWRIIPDEISHLVAWASFAVYEFSETQVGLRLRVIDSVAAEDNNSQSEIVDDLVMSTRVSRNGHIVTSENEMAQLEADYPYTSGFRVRAMEVDLALSNVDQTSPGKCEVRLEMRANAWTGASYATPVRVQPLGAIAAWQMRYA